MVTDRNGESGVAVGQGPSGAREHLKSRNRSAISAINSGP